MRPLMIFLIVICAILGLFTIYVIAHELTHIIRMDEPKGVCFGNCEGHAGAAYGKFDHLNVDREEFYATAVGLICCIGYLALWLVAVWRLE